MRERVAHVLLSGLERVLTSSGTEAADSGLSRAETVEWARTRLLAIRARRGVVAGVGAVVTQPGRVELRPLEVLLPGAGEITVEVIASAISAGTERAQWLRLPNAQPRLPFRPGYSGVGRVLAVGAGADGLAAEMRVAVQRLRHQSVATVPAAWAAPVPDGVSDADAALVYLAVIAGYGVRRAGRIAGEPVCVLGAGPVGALAQRLAQLAGARPVTVVAGSRRREAAALAAGADRFLTPADGTLGIDAAAVIDATGDPAAFAAAVAATRAGGTVVLLGSPRGVTDAPLAEIHRKGLRVVGAHISALAAEARRSGGDPFRELGVQFLTALAAGQLDVSDLAGEPVDPRELGLLYRRLARGEVTGAHLEWSRLPRAERVRRQLPLSRPPVRAAAAPVAAPPVAAAPRAARPLRFALIGCGDIGLQNANAIRAAPNADLAICYDTAPELAAAAARRAGGTVAATLEEALDPDRADAAFLCVPHDLHAPLAATAAHAGLHIVVEKPLAATLEGAEEAVAAADAAGVALSVCFSFRYHPMVRAARQLIDDGAIGELKGATVVFHADKPASYWTGGFSGRSVSDWRASRERAGGGVLIMNLAHYADLVRHLTGARPVWVAAAGRTEEGAEVEDAVALAVRFEGGALGSYSASASTRGAPRTRFEIWGETGTLQLEPEPSAFSERAVGGLVPGRWAPLAPGAVDDSRPTFVERFAAAVLGGRPPEVSATDGLAAQVFVDAAYRAMDGGVPISVEPFGAVA